LFYDSAFQKRIREGKVKEIGTRALNTELVIESELDVLFTFAVDAGSYEGIQQLRKLGQPAIVISEYMESDPVDKAKWLKVFAAFFDKSSQEMAQQHLNAVQRRYDSIKLQSSLNSQLPAVAIGLPWKGTWYVSGGNSYQAQLIKDAGANYCWNNYNQVASVPLDIETAISKGMQANFWINPGSITTANNLSESNTAFQSFSAFKNEKIYTNYKRSNQLGANDYWEMGVVRPDLILSDLVSIFHHEGKDSLTFYQSVFE
jgi:iron complex transport system substrate-binding protein